MTTFGAGFVARGDAIQTDPQLFQTVTKALIEATRILQSNGAIFVSFVRSQLALPGRPPGRRGAFRPPLTAGIMGSFSPPFTFFWSLPLGENGAEHRASVVLPAPRPRSCGR